MRVLKREIRGNGYPCTKNIRTRGSKSQRTPELELPRIFSGRRHLPQFQNRDCILHDSYRGRDLKYRCWDPEAIKLCYLNLYRAYAWT